MQPVSHEREMCWFIRHVNWAFHACLEEQRGMFFLRWIAGMLLLQCTASSSSSYNGIFYTQYHICVSSSSSLYDYNNVLYPISVWCKCVCAKRQRFDDNMMGIWATFIPSRITFSGYIRHFKNAGVFVWQFAAKLV